ncbi:hypothetical protein D3C71_1250490 [compost metagenome]
MKSLKRCRCARMPTASVGPRSGGRPKVPTVLRDVYSIIWRRPMRSSIVSGTCHERVVIRPVLRSSTVVASAYSGVNWSSNIDAIRSMPAASAGSSVTLSSFCPLTQSWRPSSSEALNSSPVFSACFGMIFVIVFICLASVSSAWSGHARSAPERLAHRYPAAPEARIGTCRDIRRHERGRQFVTVLV